ncbi:isoprenylcysteine carboxylmethyltransferase family protein [Leucobacter sp. USCH14]|uniref:methyltransferase family protein n=1 Tax=Leucobacter sp. USCH14 TaxID=3024838 RepID=UPI0030B7D3BB
MQGGAGALWWVGVFTVPGVRRATLGGLDPVLIAAFDVPLFVCASLLAAVGLRWAAWIAVPWTLLVALGMAAYSTLTGLAGWGAVAMVAAALGSAAAGVLLRYGRVPSERLLVGPFAFREAERTTDRRNLARTGRQLAVFWVCFLALLPLAIAAIEARWGLRIAFPVPLGVVGGGCFAAGSALGIWSALTMSTRGAGTPLPSATARRLVIAGPYRWVRNPMAVAGIAQGIGVGCMLGSWMVVVYALAGSCVWNWVIRPHEEADLLERFGAEFDAYARDVACWVPRRPRALPR